MPLAASDLVVRYTVTTGAAGDSTVGTPAGSLGKYASTTVAAAGLNGLFDDISATENQNNIVDYRSLAILNNNATVTNTTGAVILAGTLIHITGCWDNIASVTAPTITSSTVGGATATANHATAVGSGVTTTAGAGIWHQCFRCTHHRRHRHRRHHRHPDLEPVGGEAGRARRRLVRCRHHPARHGRNRRLHHRCPDGATTGTALVAGDLVIGSVSFENSAR
jgi:hypothetical protein